MQKTLVMALVFGLGATAAIAETDSCLIRAGWSDTRMSLSWNRGDCVQDQHCHEGSSDMLWTKWTGITPQDLQHEGTDIDARMKADSGEMRCVGTIHAVRDGRLEALRPRQRLLRGRRRLEAHRAVRYPGAEAQPGEVEAVLAHELGHYKLHHIKKFRFSTSCSPCCRCSSSASSSTRRGSTKASASARGRWRSRSCSSSWWRPHSASSCIRWRRSFPASMSTRRMPTRPATRTPASW